MTRTISSAKVDEFSSEFARVLGGPAVIRLDDTVIASGLPHQVWQRVTLGGWLDVLAELSAAEELHRCDLVEISRIWGQHLLPIPFATSVLARLWLGSVPAGVTAVTFRLPERAGSCVVPFGAWPGIHMLDPSQMTVAPVDDQGRSHPAAASTPTLELRRVAAGKPLPAAHHADLLCFWAGEASGLASNAVRLATSHAKERKAYGQPIGGFQAIQHWLVDMHRDEELSHSTAIWAANEGNPARRAAAATESMRLALSVVSRSVQVFGGIGFTWDFGLHYWIRHIMATRRLAAGLSPADPSAMPRSSSRPSTASV